MLTAFKYMSHNDAILGFCRDCPSGRLTKNELVKMYEELFPIDRAKTFVDLVFVVFERSKTKKISKL